MRKKIEFERVVASELSVLGSLLLLISLTSCDLDDGGEESVIYNSGLVVTTDFITGSYSTVSLDDYSVNMDIDTIHSDAVCRFDPLTATPFIIQRFGSDAVSVLSPEDFSIVHEYSVGASTNPHDIAVVAEDRAYISRNMTAEMLVVHPMTGDEIGTVDLSEFDDSDGIPEMSGMYIYDGKVYVLMSLLDIYSTPTGPGALAVIDGESGEIEESFELSCPNPYEARYSEALGALVISMPGDWTTIKDGGIEFFNPDDSSLSGLVVVEEDLGGNVASALVATASKGYAIIGAEGSGTVITRVVSFNPNTGEMMDTVLDGDGWIYNGMALTPDGGELWIADGTTDNPGIRIIDTSDDIEITEDPIYVGLPPMSICFAGA